MVDKNFFGSVGELTLGELLDGANVSGHVTLPEDVQKPIDNAQTLDIAQTRDICLAAHKSYANTLASTRAGAVLVTSALAEFVPSDSVALVCEEPHILYVRILEFLFPLERRRLATSPMLGGEKDFELEGDVTIAANVIIGSKAQIGQGTVVGPNTVIGPNVCIGRNCVIGANVTIECSLIGDHVVIANGARIGNDGFGWLDFGKTNIRIPQLGRTIIQSNVEIGANTVIDRGALDDTVIGENSKVGGLVKVGHGSKIARNCLLAPMVGLAGATILEDGVLMGANVGTVGHISIGRGSVVHPRASVTKDWPAGSRIAGTPAQDIKDMWREYAAVRRLAKGKKK